MLCSSNILYVISQPPETITRGYTTTPECCKVVLRSVMGKNKPRIKKQQNVFQVANKQGKSKNMAKRVKTSLKQMNAVKHEKVENLNQIFTEVQRDVKSISKSVAPAPQKPTQTVREPPKEAVNVDSAAQLFSQLGQK
ncbi:unnamed protein product [Gadus morhua 'NCC']